MPYLNLDLDYATNVKTIRLVGICGVVAEFCPVRLWMHAGKHHATDGLLRGYSDEEAEAFAGWRGEKGVLISAMIKVGLIHRTDEGLQLHDWADHEGHLGMFKERARKAAKERWGTKPPNGARRAKATRSQRLAEARRKATHTKEQWDALRNLFAGHCARCGTTDLPLEKDHIMPIYKGGSDGIENIQPSCARCNASRGSEETDHRANRLVSIGIAQDETSAKRLLDACKMPTPTVPTVPTNQKDKDLSAADAAPKPRKPKLNLETTPFWKETIAFIDETWKKKKGASFYWQGQTFKKLKSLIGLHQPWGVMSLWETYLGLNDLYAKNAGYSFEMFEKKLPTLVDDPGWKGRARKYEDQLLGPVGDDLANVLNGVVPGESLIKRAS